MYTFSTVGRATAFSLLSFASILLGLGFIFSEVAVIVSLSSYLLPTDADLMLPSSVYPKSTSETGRVLLIWFEPDWTDS
jgi:hypothetical protein